MDGKMMAICLVDDVSLELFAVCVPREPGDESDCEIHGSKPIQQTQFRRQAQRR